LLDWFGWLPDLHHSGVFRGFRFWVLVLEHATVVASFVAWRIFRFPLLVFAAAASTWFGQHRHFAIRRRSAVPAAELL
jgi:hypothetical protein